MKLLAVGDMHLGRVPAALPEGLHEQARALGPETAWRRCVDHAIQADVEAVLLAGDVVDRSRDFFAGYSALKAGVEQLLAEGIQVIAVAGNHDTGVLPRLADAVPGLRLLGRGGQWQTHALSGASILGWSFPSEHVSHSPLESLPNLPTHPIMIGLLHCDRDQTGSRYAPVSSAKLAAAPVAAWLLGHVHKPDFSSGRSDNGRPIGYLGSVSALRASETGVHGPWLLEVDNGRIQTQQIGLAPLAFDGVELDVSELEQAQDLMNDLLDAAKKRVEQRLQNQSLPDALGLRIRLIGETRLGLELQSVIDEQLKQQPIWQEAGCQLFFDQIRLDTQPAIDLAEQARQTDAVGVLARHLLILEGPDSDERKALIRQGQQRLAALNQFREFKNLESEIDAERTAEWLKRAGRTALTRMLAERL
ncbi:MAG: metallophosphoesterase [Pseudomonadota bacterium]